MLYLLRFLDRDKFHPYLIIPSGPLSDAAARVGVQTIDYTFEKRYESIKIGSREILLNPYCLLYRLRDALRFWSIIRREQIDIVHTNNLDSHLAGWFLNKLFGIPVIWHIRVSIWPRSLYAPPWVTRIVFCSQWSRQMALGPGPYNHHSLVIPNGLDPMEFKFDPKAASSVRQEFGLPQRVSLIGTTGRLDPIKRYEALIHAAYRLKQSDVEARWLLVGGEIENRSGWSYEERLRRLVTELGLEREVIMTGFRRDVARLVSAFDLYVFPGTQDSNPRSVLEAMALGKPIIAMNGGGVPEMLDYGQAGVLLDPGTSEQIADAVAGLLADPVRAQKLSERARQRVLEHYTIQEVTRKIERVYEDVLAERGRGV